MKQELELALVDVINTTTQAKDFILAETPDVVQQLLTWRVYSHSMDIGLFLLCVPLFYFILRYTVNNYRQWETDDNALATIMPILSVVLGLFSVLFTIVSICSVYSLVQIKVAPKVFLIEYAIDLVNK